MMSRLTHRKLLGCASLYVYDGSLTGLWVRLCVYIPVLEMKITLARLQCPRILATLSDKRWVIYEEIMIMYMSFRWWSWWSDENRCFKHSGHVEKKAGLWDPDLTLKMIMFHNLIHKRQGICFTFLRFIKFHRPISP